MNPVRIVIVDDHGMVREGFKMAIESIDNFVVVGEADNGERGVELVRNLNPDIAVLDIDMPGMTGIEAAQKCREFNSDVKILILTMLNDEDYIFDALSAGVDGFIYKMAKMSTFKEAVEHLSKGETYFSQRVTNFIVRGMNKKKNEANSIELSHREKEILNLVVQGMTSTEIADKLFLSYHTITTHRKHIGEKLGIKNSAELVKYAINTGIA